MDSENETLQLLHEIRDAIVALIDKIDVQERQLDSIEKRRKRPDHERQAILIERVLGRYDATSAEFYDHIPYLMKRVSRIYRAGTPLRKQPWASTAARSRTNTRSRRV